MVLSMSDPIKAGEIVIPPQIYHGQLQFFANFVVINSLLGSSLKCTVLVKGIVLSGTLIGVREYYQLYVELHGDALPENLRQGYVALGISLEDRYKDLARTDPMQLREAITPFYMKDAFIIGGVNPLPVQKGILWEGRTDQVDGFSLSSFAPEH